MGPCERLETMRSLNGSHVENTKKQPASGSNQWDVPDRDAGILVLNNPEVSLLTSLDLSSICAHCAPIRVLSEVDFGQFFPKLQRLGLCEQRIRDLSAVGCIFTLKHLDASKNLIISSSVVALQHCRLLETLILADNFIDWVPKVSSSWGFNTTLTLEQRSSLIFDATAGG